MDAIQVALSARVNKPAGLTTGDVPVWNGSSWVRPSGTASASVFLRGDGSWAVAGVKTTTSLFSGGPPGSPADGDVWIATAVDTGNLATTNGTRWAFQYNASSGSTYKWEFIGGSAYVVRVNTLQNAASATYGDLGTVGPSITLSRGGDYVVDIGAFFQQTNTGAHDQFMSYSVGATAASDTWSVQQSQYDAATPRSSSSPAGSYVQTAVAASATLTAKYRSSVAVSDGWGNRWMKVIPARVI